jgi:hypothetical protein
MKKIALLFSLAIGALGANAQITLTTSPYTQNFDDIANGLPDGWSCYSASSAASIGNFESFSGNAANGIFVDTSACAGNVFGGGFKNYPSAEVVSPAASCAAQQLVTNRALGVRQVSPTNATHPNLDSGAAFVLELANTTNLKSFNLSYHLQSLDTLSPRVTTWQVDYAIGTPTNFIPVTNVTGYWKTGGDKFYDTVNTVNFGTALDNKSGPVYIRIVTLLFSSGTGNRASTAIDDYSLSWSTINGVENVTAEDMPLTVIGNATSNSITIGYAVKTAGTYKVAMTDMTGRVVYTTEIAAQTGTQHLNINNLNLPKGMYVVKMANAATTGVTKVMVQ